MAKLFLPNGGEYHMLAKSREHLGLRGLDHQLADIAREVEKMIEHKTGVKLCFSLFLFTDGVPALYVSNTRDNNAVVARVQETIDKIKGGNKPLIYNDQRHRDDPFSDDD